MKNLIGRPGAATPVAILLFAAAALAAQGGAAGVKWETPAKWKELPARQMRVATYSVPAAPGDAEPAECAIFFFGTGQGGDAESNIQRWAGQFEGSSKPARSTRSSGDMKVQIVEIEGTYTGSGGPMMTQAPVKKAGYKLLGAIVPAPEGSVFFKLTGPAKTVNAARGDFDALIASIKSSQRA